MKSWASNSNQAVNVPIKDGGEATEKRGAAKTPMFNAIPSPSSYVTSGATSAAAAMAAVTERSLARSSSSSSRFPHNCEAILRNADTPLDLSSDQIMDRLHKGVFLKNKRQKYWVESSSNSNCFMVYARDLSITWSESTNYWSWFSLKESPNDTLVDAVELKNVCWLEINGKLDATNLTPGTTYEVVFVVKLEDPAYGWDTPVNVKLTLPSGQIPERNVSLREQMRYRWLEIPAGEFVASAENTGEIRFSMYEHESGSWKKGLFVKGVAVRPKSH